MPGHATAPSPGGCLAQVIYGFDVREAVGGECVSKYMVRQINPASQLQGRTYSSCPTGQIYAYDGASNDIAWHEVGCSTIEIYPYVAQ
jgi:hypothetical protein